MGQAWNNPKVKAEDGIGGANWHSPLRMEHILYGMGSKLRF